MRSLPTPAPPSTARRQLSIPFASGRLQGMSLSERSTALARLASLLLEAADVAGGERDDDQQ